MQSDNLFRISLKCLIKNDQGEVLVVKETRRTSWDLPGGGMDHAESFKTAIARELTEEVDFRGAFTYRIIAVEEPKLLLRDLWQVRLVFFVETSNIEFRAGLEADEVKFINPEDLRESDAKVERLVYQYAKLVL
jgi:8-oxo-dGTP pyrophosphatase MutT (NUDIX family)